jgi:hypothetical protein
VTAEVKLQGEGQTTLYLSPGTTIVYHWEAIDQAGNTGESPEATFFYDDDRFEWQSTEQGGVTIYYYGGNDETAQEMLGTALRPMPDVLFGQRSVSVKVAPRFHGRHTPRSP